MKTHLVRLFEYNQWANQLFCETILNADYQNKKIDVLISHTLAAELIWLDRISPVNTPVLGVWELLSLNEAIESLKAADELWLSYLKEDPAIDTVIKYTDSAGKKHQTILKDIITHVANHGTHHRGQLATLLRQENIAPPASDFIFFARS
jgi:uncharacterized damage-inducible protein DinB